jgi:putative ATP-dependent endonuclease of OLD family
LLPVLARIAGGNLKKSSVTVLNADGINFDAFIPLFGVGRLGLPVVILTDGDAKEIGGEMSATAAGLKALESDVPNLSVEMSEITFEHELARSGEMLPHMIEAFKALRPRKGASLEPALGALDSADDRASAFLRAFLASRVSKGQFAQELAGAIDGCDLGRDAVPTYIQQALRHLGVLGEAVADGHG